MYYPTDRFNRNLKNKQMTQANKKDEVVEIYLFSDPKPEIGSEQSSEVDDRPMELSSRINAVFAMQRIKHDLSWLDAVISSSLPRAQELARILAERSVNTPRKKEGRRHFEDHLEIDTIETTLNVVPNDGYQPVLVISDINHITVTQLASAIEELLPGRKVLIVLDAKSLENLAQKLTAREVGLNLNFAEGVKITLGKNREISNIRQKRKI